MSRRIDKHPLNYQPFRQTFFGALGIVLVGLVLFADTSSEISVILSVLGLASLMASVSGFGGRELGTHSKWTQLALFGSLAIAAFVDIVLPLKSAPLVMAMALTVCILSTAYTPTSRIPMIAPIVAAGIMVFGTLRYYAIDIGNDSWGYLGVATAMSQHGQFDLAKSIGYYSFWPVVSYLSYAFSALSGLSLVDGLYATSGALILSQPLLVYLVTMKITGNRSIAALSAIVVITEVSVLQWVNAPIAESVAISLFLTTLVIMLGQGPNGRRTLLVALLFFITVMIHGAVAIVGLVVLSLLAYRNREKFLIPLLGLLAFGYFYMSSTLYVIVGSIYNDFYYVLGGEVYATSTNFFIPNAHVTYISFGFVPALGLFVLLNRRRVVGWGWALMGLILLGTAFIVTSRVPELGADRYLGLASWIILAVPAGSSLRTLTNTDRKLLAMAPVVFLVLLSVVVSPAISPQYGYGHTSDLPTTNIDRVGIIWMNHEETPNMTSDILVGAYSIFSQSFLARLPVLAYPDNLTLLTDMIPGKGNLVFVRWADLASSAPVQQCTTPLLDREVLANNSVAVVYSNGCDTGYFGT